MSVPKPRVLLGPQAERDYSFILVYTRRTWGERQTAKYRAKYRATSYRALDMLSQYPDAGQPRDDRCPGCRSLQVEQHVIYFHQPGPGEIEVLRILHQGQDASATVNDPRS